MKKGLQPALVLHRFLFSLFWLLLPLAPAFSQQQGQLDPSFNPTDLGFNTGIGASNIVYTTTQGQAGKLLIGGSFTAYNGTTINRVALLNANGTLDANFNPGTGANGIVYASARQADGRFLIGGVFTMVNGVPRARIARLNTDGSLDTGFDPGLGADAQVSAIAIQQDGKILVGGKFIAYNSDTVKYLIRLNANATPDPTFNTGSSFDKSVSAITIQPDGKILVGGDFTNYNGVAYNRIIRLNQNGTADASFTPGTGAAGTVKTIARQTDGKIIIGGTFKKFNGITKNRIARLNADGTLDASFIANASSTVSSVAIQPNNNILAGGDFVTMNGVPRNRIASLNPDGTPNLTFDPGTGYNSSVYTVSVLPTGGIIVGGKFTVYNNRIQFRISRLNPDATIDNTFNPGSGANGVINAFALQPDGKIIIGGAFSGFNGIPRNRIARLNTDGTVDLSFTPGAGPDNSVLSLAIQPDGKIIVAGLFKKVNGIVKNRIVRLNSDGTVDPTFVTGTGAGNIIYIVKLQADGKILVGGKFVGFNGSPKPFLVRLNTDGSVDQTFSSNGTGFNKSVHSLAIQPDGKIIAGGEFTTFNGVANSRLIRLNSDGSLDPTFTIGAGAAGTVKSMALQADGKIIIGGTFLKYNNIVKNRIARITSNGVLDTSFDPGTGTNAIVQALALQTDGKIIAAGEFVTYNGVTANRLVRLLPTGAIDLGFNTGAGADAPIFALALQTNGHVLIGGKFTNYNNTGRNRAARVFGELITPPSITTGAVSTAGICPGGTVNVPFTVNGAFTPGNIFSALLSDVTGSFANPVSVGGVIGTTAGTITATLPMGLPAGTGYRIKVIGSTPAIIGTTNTTNLTVISSPTVAAVASPGSICFGASTSLSASGAVSYSWSTGQTGNTVTVTPAATTTYTVTGTSGLGCAAQGTVQVLITPPPSLNVTAASATICTGQTTTLSVTGGTTYTWQPAPGLTGSGSTVSVTPATPGIHTYTVTGANGACAPVQATVQVEALAPQNAAFSYPANAFCTSATNPTPTTFSAGVFTSSPAGLVFADSLTGTINLAASAAGVYSVVFTTSGPCAASSASTTITLTGAPTVSTTPNISVCAGTPVILQATGVAGATYSWNGPNNFTATGATVNLTNTTTGMSGAYTVTAFLNGCSQTTTSNVAISVAPVAGFTYLTGGCAGCISVFNSTPAPNTYSYDFGDGSAPSTHPNPVHQYAASGTYTITQTVTNATGCSTTSTQVVSIILASADELESNTKIYPNPTFGKLIIELPEIAGTAAVSAEVYTVTGQLKQIATLTAGTLNELNLAGLQAGAYLLRISTAEGTLVKQILLQN